jgi:hypothetical protein
MCKAISLLLALIMVVSVLSTVFTVNAIGDEALVKASAPQLLGSSAGMWALEKLGGGVISGIAGKGINEAFAAIFGSETDAVLAKLNEMLSKIDRINENLDILRKQYATGQLYNVLNEYQSFIGPYVGLLDLLMEKSKAFADKPAETKEFLMDIYKGEKANYRIGGDNMLMLTLKLTKKLLQVNNNEYNLFGAFDKLDRHINKWEHQGYESRQEFRDSVLTFYTAFMALSQLACKTAMEDVPEGSYLYKEREIELNKLINDAKLVNEMNKRCAIIKHPDLCIYRDTVNGVDLYAFYKRVSQCNLTNVDGLPEWDDFEKKVTKNSFFSFSFMRTANLKVTYRSGGAVIRSEQAPRDFFERIIEDYKSEHSDQKIDLYDIIFNKCGFIDFTTDNGPKKGAWFATDYHVYSHWRIDIFCATKEWKTEAFNNDGELVFNVRLAQQVSRGGRYTDHAYLNTDYFFSIEQYTGLVKQGALFTSPTVLSDGLISGMDGPYELPCNDEVTLSVDEKEGAEYEWFVNKNDDQGFVKIENEINARYTLPVLEANMNGWMYRCGIISKPDGGSGDYTLTAPVILVLAGEGISDPMTVHEVGTAEEIKAALDKVSDGSWNNHTLKLTKDINYPYPISLTGGREVAIDLNGHTLTVQPDNNAEPNINPMSDHEEIAAIYACFGSLSIVGDGTLDVVASDGIAYGVYAGESGSITVSSVTSTDGGTAVYAIDSGSVEITGDVSAKGESAYAIECFEGSTVKVGGDVSVDGNTSCGVYAESYNGQRTLVEVGGNIIVTGDNSQAAFLNADYTALKVQGNVMVTGTGSSGISAGGGNAENRCTAIIFGDINAPMDAVNAWDNADVRVYGNVTVTDEYATAVSATGALVQLRGNVTSEGKEGTGIHASAWDLADSVVGAMVKSDVKITAFKPLLIKGIIVEESEHSNESVYAGYYTFTDGTNTVWAKPGSFVKISGSDSDTTPSPQTGDASNIVLYTFILFSSAGIIAMIFYTKKRHMVSPANRL